MGREKRGQEVPGTWRNRKKRDKPDVRKVQTLVGPPPLWAPQSASLVFKKVLTNDQLTFRIN